jgi:hypothetical protein
MTTSPIDYRPAYAVAVQVTVDRLTVDLADGRSISAPLAWYPRLGDGTAAERTNWRLIGRGEGVHWPDLDEDISIDNLLSGARSLQRRRQCPKLLNVRVVPFTELAHHFTQRRPILGRLNR